MSMSWLQFFKSTTKGSALSFAFIHLDMTGIPAFCNCERNSDFAFTEASIHVSAFLGFGPAKARAEADKNARAISKDLFMELIIRCCYFLVL